MKVDDHGAADRAQILKKVTGSRLTDCTMNEMRFVLISRKTGMISYRILKEGTSHGGDFMDQTYGFLPGPGGGRMALAVPPGYRGIVTQVRENGRQRKAAA